MVEMTTAPVVETRVKRSHFGDNSTSGIMVHAITKEVVVAPRQKVIKKMLHSINNSTGEIEIITIVVRKKCMTAWDRQ